MADCVETLQLTVGEGEEGERLDAWLAAHLAGWSRTRVQQLIRCGHVESGGKTGWRSKDRVIAGQEYRISPPPPEPVALAGEEIPLDIIYEDRDLIVINKPPGLVVHPAPGHAGGTLVNALLFHCRDLEGVGGERRPGIVHRLDKDTSGVMVAAKNQCAMDALAVQF